MRRLLWWILARLGQPEYCELRWWGRILEALLCPVQTFRWWSTGLYSFNRDAIKVNGIWLSLRGLEDLTYKKNRDLWFRIVQLSPEWYAIERKLDSPPAPPFASKN